jgi:hypothetical protein
MLVVRTGLDAPAPARAETEWKTVPGGFLVSRCKAGFIRRRKKAARHRCGKADGLGQIKRWERPWGRIARTMERGSGRQRIEGGDRIVTCLPS